MKTLFVRICTLHDKWEGESAWENNQNFRKFENRGKWYRNFGTDKFLEIPEAIQGRS